MKKKSRRNEVAAMGLSVVLGFGLLSAKAVDWPSDYDQKLAEHIAATTPSGSQVGTSSALAVESAGAGVSLSEASSVDAPGVSVWQTLFGIPVDTSPLGFLLFFR